MKTSSAKAKGRRLQQKVAKQIQYDAQMEKRTYDEVYRACKHENTILTEKLKACR